MDRPHAPALVHEVARLLAGKAAVIDATVGAGGHAEALLEAGVGTVLGLDRDPSALEEAAARLGRFGDRVRLMPARFSRLGEVAGEAGLVPVGGVLFDLGLSSMQLDRPERGFSYRAGGPLDMRMDPGNEGPTAQDLVNNRPEEELARIIYEYGEERRARRIARAIVRTRARKSIRTTDDLAGVVASAVPRRRGGPHPARRTFQALRIAINEELAELAASLPQAASLLEPRGRLVVIAYHSLEDRAVKRFIAGEPSLTAMLRKPIRPEPAELATNPRVRSARLRAAERLPAERLPVERGEAA